MRRVISILFQYFFQKQHQNKASRSGRTPSPDLMLPSEVLVVLLVVLELVVVVLVETVVAELVVVVDDDVEGEVVADVVVVGPGVAGGGSVAGTGPDPLFM